MATATPGPWALAREDWSIRSQDLTSDQMGDFRGVVIADLRSAHGGRELAFAEAEANARLISAAPELLAALKLVMAMLEDGRLVRDITKDGRPDYSMAMLALVRDLQTIQSAIFKAEAR